MARRSDTLIGEVKMWLTDTPPEGYLLCDGSAVSRTVYSDLFALIGTTYGVGDGSTTFNLPDIRQRFPLGKAASGTGNALGVTGGTIDHVHDGPVHTHSTPAHYHGMGTGADLNLTAGGSHAHSNPVYTYPREGDGEAPGGRRLCEGDDNGAGTINTDAATHVHAAGEFAGSIGLVTGGVDGNAAMTTGTAGGAETGQMNPPFIAVNFIVKY